MSNVQAKLGTGPHATSSSTRTKLAIFALLSIGGCIADLWTKQLVFAWKGLPGTQEPWWLIQDYVGIETAVNEGALFGMGAGYGAVFALLSVFAAIAIVIWLFGFGASKSFWLTVALGLVMAGIGGNLYDRLGFWYEPTMPLSWKSGVRDWILFRYGQYTWPNFNIADSLLVCGAFLLAWHSFMSPDESNQSLPTSEGK